MDSKNVKVNEVVSIKEYNNWEKFVGTHEEVMNHWPVCGDCNGVSCSGCFWNLVDLKEENKKDHRGEFLYRVKIFVEGMVEELYMHTPWTKEEEDEFGIEVGYLVSLYFKYNLGDLK